MLYTWLIHVTHAALTPVTFRTLYRMVRCTVAEFSVTVEPAIVEEYTHHSSVWQVVLTLSGTIREI